MKEGAINIDLKKFKKDNDCYDELIAAKKTVSLFMIIMKIHKENVQGTRVYNVIMDKVMRM
jgi:hypothetical protein